MSDQRRQMWTVPVPDADPAFVWTSEERVEEDRAAFNRHGFEPLLGWVRDDRDWSEMRQAWELFDTVQEFLVRHASK